MEGSQTGETLYMTLYKHTATYRDEEHIELNASTTYYTLLHFLNSLI
jgi:hypothetical protein